MRQLYKFHKWSKGKALLRLWFTQEEFIISSTTYDLKTVIMLLATHSPESLITYNALIDALEHYDEYRGWNDA